MSIVTGGSSGRENQRLQVWACLRLQSLRATVGVVCICRARAIFVSAPLILLTLGIPASHLALKDAVPQRVLTPLLLRIVLEGGVCASAEWLAETFAIVFP